MKLSPYMSQNLPSPERVRAPGDFFVQNYTPIIHKFLLFSRWRMWYTKLIYCIEHWAGGRSRLGVLELSVIF